MILHKVVLCSGKVIVMRVTKENDKFLEGIDDIYSNPVRLSRDAIKSVTRLKTQREINDENMKVEFAPRRKIKEDVKSEIKDKTKEKEKEVRKLKRANKNREEKMHKLTILSPDKIEHVVENGRPMEKLIKMFGTHKHIVSRELKSDLIKDIQEHIEIKDNVKTLVKNGKRKKLTEKEFEKLKEVTKLWI